ncbi:MAG: MurR/RpiR family transcriptional regulator [Anaerolineales bacterium]
MPAGTYAERIREARPELSKSFQRLADYILDSYVQAALMTAQELAHQVDVDSATVVRFAQAIGYSGFPALQDEIKARVVQDLLIRPKEIVEPESLSALTDLTLKELGEAIERTRRLMDTAPLEALLTALGKSKRVFLLADAHGQFIVPELLRHFQNVGILPILLNAEEGAMARSLALAVQTDLLLVIDLNGQTPLVPAALGQAKTSGVPAAAIVGSASFEAARRTNIVLEVQSQEQTEGAAVVLSALIHTIGTTLRWRYAEKFKENQKQADKVLKRLAAAKGAR